MTRLTFPHSYIGIQPAKTDQPIRFEDRPTGIHHIAVYAKSKREVDQFYREFLVKEQVAVTDPPEAYPHHALGYYAVFFLDLSGIRSKSFNTKLVVVKNFFAMRGRDYDC